MAIADEYRTRQLQKLAIAIDSSSNSPELTATTVIPTPVFISSGAQVT
ncbi:MAG: hypothetical protein COB30_002080 [Ectothiorhodospiraceae bacterium]|nr:hypothetical protein [Ectothiorhodospiraceae bacterium]